MRMPRVCAVPVLAALLAGCGGKSMLTLTSSAFTEGKPIPAAHAYRDKNLSPPLAWTNAPAGTKTFALICDDPDAPSGSWVHWVVFDIPAAVATLPAGAPKDPKLSGGAVQGTNDFNALGWDGPSPPSGTHRYVFSLYALDAALGLKPGAKRDAVMKAMKGRVLAEGKLTGTHAAK